LGEAVKYLQQLGMKEIFEHEKVLTEHAEEKMQTCCTKLKLYGTTDPALKCGIIPFGVEGLSSHDVALFCDNYGIMLRSGFHAPNRFTRCSKLSSAHVPASTSTHQRRSGPIRRILKEIEQF